MLPPPAFTPFTTRAMSTAPKDPLPFKLNPWLPVSDEAIAVARNVFPEAKAFLTLFDSSFVVVYDQEEVVCDHMVVPERFGGLEVVLDYNYFNFSSALASEATVLAPDSIALEPESPAVDAKKIVPGNTLFLQGPRYGQEPTKTIPTKAIQFILRFGTVRWCEMTFEWELLVSRG
jgi:hypothetical protein